MSNKDVQEISTRDARLGLRTWIEIDTKAIENNYQIFRSLLKPETKLLSVVKSNAYGHGLVDFSKHIEKLGIDWLAADAVVEALRLRKEGIEVPILVLGYTLPERMQEAINNNISLTISNMYALQGLKQLGLEGKMKIHIKVDSGMHRQGFMEDELDAVLEFLLKHKNEIEVEGLYTHFASAKDPTQIVETTFQVKVFEQWIHAFKKAGFKPLVHAAATGAAILFPETHYDMVRIGIGLHGLWPSAEVQAHRQKEMPLMPTLSWKTIVSEIKTLPTGSKIGYDFTHTVIHGIRVKVLGRVSMDMLVIDITDIPQTKIGDEVVLIGASEDNYLSAHDVALLSGVSTYEFVTRINPLIKKIYL
ncbi:MAG: alanine racemase [Candidatus Paceibacter sp.]|nr:alanine racemase [Candidatus Paceibacter sp.]